MNIHQALTVNLFTKILVLCMSAFIPTKYLNAILFLLNDEYQLFTDVFSLTIHDLINWTTYVLFYLKSLRVSLDK